MECPPIKPILWVGSALRDLRTLSADVQDEIGYALYFAQLGRRHPSAKVLQGFGSADVLEIRTDDAGGAYRGVYTVKFKRVVYVLHVFQKKSKKGIRTPTRQIELIKQRLAIAAAHFQEHHHEFENG